MAVDLTHVSRLATALLDHYGSGALSAAQKQVESASTSGNLPALDQAFMVLTEIERRLAAGPTDTP
jgi:hypothetical protein